MYTVVETPTFAADADKLWSTEERAEFCAWIAAHPYAGNVVPGSGGCHKVRWSRPGMGKRGGVRVLYFTRLANGEIWLLVIYAKNTTSTIPPHLEPVYDLFATALLLEKAPGGVADCRLWWGQRQRPGRRLALFPAQPEGPGPTFFRWRGRQVAITLVYVE